VTRARLLKLCSLALACSGPGARAASVDELIKLSALGASDADLIGLVLSDRATPGIDEATLAVLTRAGVSASVLDALRCRALRPELAGCGAAPAPVPRLDPTAAMTAEASASPRRAALWEAWRGVHAMWSADFAVAFSNEDPAAGAFIHADVGAWWLAPPVPRRTAGSWGFEAGVGGHFGLLSPPARLVPIEMTEPDSERLFGVDTMLGVVLGWGGFDARYGWQGAILRARWQPGLRVHTSEFRDLGDAGWTWTSFSVSLTYALIELLHDPIEHLSFEYGFGLSFSYLGASGSMPPFMGIGLVFHDL